MTIAAPAAPRPAGRLAAAAAAALALLALLLVAVLVSLDARQEAPASTAPDGLPAVYVPVYRAAGEAFGVHWLLLAAIHAQESDFSRLRVRGGTGNAVSSGWNGCGAAGPTQFGIVGVEPYGATAPSCGSLTGSGAGGTWRAFRDAHRRLPRSARPARYPQMRARLRSCAAVPPRHGCVYDDVDAIAAAAAYLRARPRPRVAGTGRGRPRARESAHGPRRPRPPRPRRPGPRPTQRTAGDPPRNRRS